MVHGTPESRMYPLSGYFLVTYNWMMKLVLRFTLKKLEELSFKKIIPKFIDRTFQGFLFGNFRKMAIAIGFT